MPHCAARRAENYDNFSCTFDFLPGAALGICPDKRQLKPSILLPFSNLILWHVIISPSAESAVSWIRVLARDSPIASAISVSSFSPCVFRNFKISCIRFWDAHHTLSSSGLSREVQCSPFTASDQKIQSLPPDPPQRQPGIIARPITAGPLTTSRVSTLLHALAAGLRFPSV